MWKIGKKITIKEAIENLNKYIEQMRQKRKEINEQTYKEIEKNGKKSNKLPILLELEEMEEINESLLPKCRDCDVSMEIKGGRYGKPLYYECPKCGKTKRTIIYF